MIIRRLSPLSAIFCKNVKQQLCNSSNGLHWVKGVQECPQSPDMPVLVCTYMLRVHDQYYTNRFIVTCRSELDGGGWTLVCQHSYMEDLPLNLSIRYFSGD